MERSNRGIKLRINIKNELKKVMLPKRQIDFFWFIGLKPLPARKIMC